MMLENKITGVRIGVMDMPYRKKSCLVVQEGNRVTKYASFNNDLSAVDFMEILARFMGVSDEEVTKK